jgi:sugar/nucleoside kinase (ribokinase family)
LSAVIGFDGFVDTIVEVVDKRHSFAEYTRMQTIADFGARISRAAGLSTNIEFVPVAKKLGGNGPIMANAMMSLGVNVSYIGALGKPTINQVFDSLVQGCAQVVSLAEPGLTDAVEFTDGKVMLGKITSLNEVTWDALVEAVGEDRIRELFTSCDLVATVNWTMMPHMNDIWENLLRVLPPNSDPDRPILFVDLADPEKRKSEDILEAMRLIGRFNSVYRVALGLNRKEATEVAEVLDLKLSAPAAEVSLEEITRALADALDLWCLMVHPTSAAAAVVDGVYAHTVGPYTSKPRLTTGAGDNFNAGFCLGLLLGLSLEQCVMLGTATSGFYVRNMHSPSFAELKDFVELWSQHGEVEF